MRKRRFWGLRRVHEGGLCLMAHINPFIFHWTAGKARQAKSSGVRPFCWKTPLNCRQGLLMGPESRLPAPALVFDCSAALALSNACLQSLSARLSGVHGQVLVYTPSKINLAALSITTHGCHRSTRQSIGLQVVSLRYGPSMFPFGFEDFITAAMRKSSCCT